MGARFYTCPECGRLLVTSSDGGPAPHDCERQADTCCPECGRVFDLTNDTDATQWVHGHDCKAYAGAHGIDLPWA